MISLTHHNDGKEKSKSHEVGITEPEFYNMEHDVWSHNFFDITGYGETKEEALKDFKKKFIYVMDEWRAFEKMLFETDYMENHIVEVNCLGWETMLHS